MAEIILATGPAPNTPSPGKITVYAKTDKFPYVKDDTGAETALIAGYSNEQAQDTIGAILTDTATVDFTYNDATPSITADVLPNSSLQKVEVAKNSGMAIGTRKQVNLIEGPNVVLTVADDSINDRTNVTIEASGSLSGYTNEEAQDAVGTILTDTATVDFTYNDATPSITASVLPNSSVQKVEVTKNSGAVVGTRKQLNLIEGANVTLTVADDGANDQVDITIASTDTNTVYTDEQAQDAIGTILTDTATVDLTYNDATPSITAAVIANTSVQKIEVTKNSGGVVGTRKQLNLIEGANVTLTVADDGVNDQVDITVASTDTTYTDEQAQDAVGTILTDTATIDFTYSDATPSITAAVIANSSVQKIEVVKNSGAVVGTRKQLNLIEGTNVTLTVADDGVNDQVDVTIAATGGSYTDEQAQDAIGTILTDTSTIDFTYNDATPSITAAVLPNTSIQKVEVVKNSGAVVGTRKQLNFVEGTGVTLSIADDAGNDQVDINISAAAGSGISFPTAMIISSLRA